MLNYSVIANAFTLTQELSLIKSVTPEGGAVASTVFGR